MEDSVKSLAEIGVDKIHCPFFIHPSYYTIIDGISNPQIGQTWFPLGEFMITTPNNLLFFYMLGERRPEWSAPGLEVRLTVW